MKGCVQGRGMDEGVCAGGGAWMKGCVQGRGMDEGVCAGEGHG